MTDFWKSIVASILSHAIVAVVVGATMFFVGRCSKECPEPEVIDLTPQQRLQIIQEARLGYIPLDSAMAMIESESKIKWIPKDSIVIKDSLNIIDSIVYIPVYEAPDTFITLYDKDTLNAHLLVEAGLKQRFLPTQQRFASSLWLSRLNISLPPEKEPEKAFYESVTIGLGIGTRIKEHYFLGNFDYKIVNTKHFEIPVGVFGEYYKDGVIKGGFEAKVQLKF